jgi:hypothetical protein
MSGTITRLVRLLVTLVAIAAASPCLCIAAGVTPNGDKLPAEDASTDSFKEMPLVQQSGCETPPSLETRLSLPAWLASLSGDSGVKGVVSTVDVGVDQLIKHLTHVPIALGADLHYHQWEFLGDGQYEEVGASATLPGLLFTTANVHVKTATVEGFIGYRLINCTRASLSLFAGARYTYTGLHLSILNNGDARLGRLRDLLGVANKLDAEGSVDWVDPVVGLRGKVKVAKAISLYAEGDVGGFDVNSGSAYELRSDGGTINRIPVSSSDWSYNVQGGVEVQLTRSIWTQLGWRYLKYDYRMNGYTNGTELNGPFLQTGMNF